MLLILGDQTQRGEQWLPGVVQGGDEEILLSEHVLSLQDEKLGRWMSAMAVPQYELSLSFTGKDR